MAVYGGTRDGETEKEGGGGGAGLGGDNGGVESVYSARRRTVANGPRGVVPDPTVVRLLARLAIGSSEDLSVDAFED